LKWSGTVKGWIGLFEPGTDGFCGDQLRQGCEQPFQLRETAFCGRARLLPLPPVGHGALRKTREAGKGFLRYAIGITELLHRRAGLDAILPQGAEKLDRFGPDGNPLSVILAGIDRRGGMNEHLLHGSNLPSH